MTSAQRPVDESANLITHGLGLLLSVVATVYLMRLVVPEHPPQTIIACGVYCSTLVLLYAASTLSHTFHDLELRRLFRTLDQACIFLTPVRSSLFHLAMPCGQNTQPRWKRFDKSCFDGTNDRKLGRSGPKSARNRAEWAKMFVGFSTVAHTMSEAVILRQSNS